MTPFHRTKRSDTISSKNGTQNGKTKLNRHDLANLTFGYANLNPMNRMNSKTFDFLAHLPHKGASQSSPSLPMPPSNNEENEKNSLLVGSTSLSHHIDQVLPSRGPQDEETDPEQAPPQQNLSSSEEKLVPDRTESVSPLSVPVAEEKAPSTDTSVTTTSLGLPNVPPHVTIPSSVRASTDAVPPFSPVPADKAEHPRKTNPATAAYRDLITGAVVETDQEGNQAEPTIHPSISSPVQQSAPGGLPALSLSNIEMPGLAAAAKFLPQERELEAAESDEQGHAQRAGSDSSVDCVPWSQTLSTQITGFAVASSKRNEDFHALFPSVPKDDYLIESYASAVSRDLLIQGRLYVSEAHLGFHSNILGWVTSIVVPFSDVVSIEKRNTAYLIPNAIVVKTLQNRYTFSSLVSRDVTYSMLVNIWRLSAPSAAAQQLAELDATDESDADEHEDDSEQEKKPDTTAETADTSVQDKGSPSPNPDENTNSKQSPHPKKTKREKLRHRLHAARANAKKKGRESGEGGVDDDSSDSDGPDGDDGKEHAVTSCNCDEKGEHLKEVVMDDVFDATPHQLFDLMFVSDFLERFFVDNQHLQDVEIGEWNSEDKTKEEAEAARKVTYVKPLNASIGPKQTRCVITDEQLHIDFDKFCTTLSTTRTPDVPNGNSFVVLTRMCFTWAEGSRARLYVTCAVEWSGRSMIKGIIDKASIDGQKEYFRDLGQMMREHISDHPEVYGASKSQQSKQTKQSADEEAEKGTQADTSNVLFSYFDVVSRQLQAFAEALDIRPSVLILALLIVILLILNIWVSWRGPTAMVRDPSNPHRLLARGAQATRPLKMQHVHVVLDEEVQSVLDALAASRRMTESLEEDIRQLQSLIQKKTQEQQTQQS
ncbi:hypothetical protein MNAN1_001193 [Malassezia nana]|uniref:VASt domain-containing protein n=1 Tax=Malassezia nana TaxID=180528 RepID=A0AAF0EK49_9BASI|nr:hypothetical protein MNAN1_001193 [Malassezia nana]